MFDANDRFMLVPLFVAAPFDDDDDVDGATAVGDVAAVPVGRYFTSCRHVNSTVSVSFVIFVADGDVVGGNSLDDIDFFVWLSNQSRYM